MQKPRPVFNLLALRLPGNVERDVNNYRTRLFEVTGAASTFALPPVIPLVYTNPDLPDDVVDRLPQTELGPLSFGRVGTEDGSAFLAVKLEPRWSAWVNSVPQTDVPKLQGVPVPGSGVFLGSADLVAAIAEAETEDRAHTERDKAPAPPVMPGQQKVLHVELLIVTADPGERWWETLDWSIPWSRRVKLRGQTVTV